MKRQNEYKKRCKAIHLYKEGYGFNKILQLVQGGKGWLSKWLKRFKEQGLKGLKDKKKFESIFSSKFCKRLPIK